MTATYTVTWAEKVGELTLNRRVRTLSLDEAGTIWHLAFKTDRKAGVANSDGEGVCLECGRVSSRVIDCIACQFDAGLDGDRGEEDWS